MPVTQFQRLLTLAALACSAQGGLLLAQTPAPELSGGFSSFRLRPKEGFDERLNGLELGGRYGLTPAWSIEGALSRQTGATEGGVQDRQLGILAGPRYSWSITPRWQVFTHFLVGREQFSASLGNLAVQGASLAFGPGVGMDFAISRQISLRAREDFIVTHYAGHFQGSPSLFLGLALRLGKEHEPQVQPSPSPEAELPPSPPVPVPVPAPLPPAPILPPPPTPAPEPGPMIVSFKWGSAQVSPHAAQELKAWIARVKALPETPSLSIHGHADSTGDRQHNQRLSLLRARKVAAILAAAQGRVDSVEGRGSSEPLASNQTRAGRARNRRVEISGSRPAPGSGKARPGPRNP